MVRRRGARSVCTTGGCPNYTYGGRCPTCQAKADTARGTAAQRGYGRQHRIRFRPAVLLRDPVCTCTGCSSCSSPGQLCTRASVHADHWPLSKRDLIEAGLDHNDPARGRGLCQRCHSTSTAEHQPGGWNQ